jgi:hypothetical protein
VEEVDTGYALRFRTTEELLGFLEECFQQALRRERGSTENRKNETMNSTT